MTVMKGAGRLVVAGTAVPPGTSERVEIPVARLPTQVTVSIPVAVVHGRKPGPRLWLSAAIHGDEVNGVEIIRRVLEDLDPARLRGAVLAVPIVNVFGFLNESRYLPDRRDLNRSFPGSLRGSLASRLARLFLDEIVENATHGIDLHTAATGRVNLPQVRADLDDPASRDLARAFAAPVMMHARVRDGSLREAARSQGLPVVVYEGGEPNRFNPEAIEAGVQGIRRVMGLLGMTGTPRRRPKPGLESRRSSWVRARRSGIFRREVELGARVAKGRRLGIISDAFGDLRIPVIAVGEGIVIGLALSPLVNRGDALVHVAAV